MSSAGNMKRLRLTYFYLGLFIMIISWIIIGSITFSMGNETLQNNLLIDLGHIAFGIALEILGLGLVVLGKR